MVNVRRGRGGMNSYSDNVTTKALNNIVAGAVTTARKLKHIPLSSYSECAVSGQARGAVPLPLFCDDKWSSASVTWQLVDCQTSVQVQRSRPIRLSKALKRKVVTLVGMLGL